MKKIIFLMLMFCLPLIVFSQKIKKDSAFVIHDTVSYLFRTITDMQGKLYEITNNIKLLPNQDDLRLLEMRIQEVKDRQNVLDSKINETVGPGNPGVSESIINDLQSKSDANSNAINNLIVDLRQMDMKIKELESIKQQLDTIQKKIMELEKK